MFIISVQIDLCAWHSYKGEWNEKKHTTTVPFSQDRHLIQFEY